MGSEFKGKDLFGSGPHRASVGPEGQQLVPRLELDEPQSGLAALGPLDVRIEVRGRLVASDLASLNALREAIRTELEAEPTPGTLVDTQGRTWTDMTFARYEEGDRVDRGRTASVAYVAEFVRLSDEPPGGVDDDEDDQSDGAGDSSDVDAPASGGAT